MKPVPALLAAILAPVFPALGAAPSKPAAPTTAPSTSTAADAAQLYRQAFSLLDGLDDADQDRLGLCGVDGCWVVTTPLDPATAQLIARQKQAIDLARTAASMPGAKWGLGSDANKVLELANRAPRLSALLVLNARHELRDGQPEQAVGDLLAALALSRHAAADPTLMTKMVEISARRPATEVLAQQLPSLSKKLVATLPARLEQLPPSPMMEQVIQGEHEFAKESALKQGFVAIAMVAGLEDFYTALAKGASLPPGQFAAFVDEQTAKYSANGWAKIIAPALKQARERTAVIETQQAMLQTAIKVVLQGEAAVALSKDEFGIGPFEYKKLPNGFELSSELKSKNQPVKMQFGAAPALETRP